MIKVMVSIKKLPNITTEQFRHHDETVHAPLVDWVLPFYATYRRNDLDGPVRGSADDVDFDVITELEFATTADYEAWLAELAKPDVLAEIRTDEAKFLVSSATRMRAVTPFASAY